MFDRVDRIIRSGLKIKHDAPLQELPEFANEVDEDEDDDEDTDDDEEEDEEELEDEEGDDKEEL